MVSEEAKKKMSLVHSRLPRPKEVKQKISESHLRANRTGINSHMFGKKHSKETKIKMSRSRANFKGENHPTFGCKHSKESKEKVKNALKGRPHSKERRQKIKEAWVKRKQKMQELNITRTNIKLLP